MTARLDHASATPNSGARLGIRFWLGVGVRVENNAWLPSGIDSRDGHEGTRLPVASVGHADLSTRNVVLSSAKVVCVVQSNVFSAKEVLSGWHVLGNSKCDVVKI